MREYTVCAVAGCISGEEVHVEPQFLSTGEPAVNLVFHVEDSDGVGRTTGMLLDLGSAQELAEALGKVRGTLLAQVAAEQARISIVPQEKVR